MRINRKMIAFFALGILSIYLMFQFLGLQQILATLSTANIYLLVLALAMHLLSVLVLSVRMRVIGGPEASMARYVKATFTGLFVNFITPVAKVGGEPVKIYMLKDRLGSTRAAAAIAMDMFIEILSSYITFLIIFILFLQLIPPGLLVYYIIFLIITSFFLLVFLKISLTPRWIGRFVNFVISKTSRFIKIEKKEYAIMFHDSFRALIKNKKSMFSSLGFSLLEKIFEFLRIWLVFIALGVVLPWPTVVVVWAFLLILLVIPWLPGGLGLVEAGTIAAFTYMGIEVHVAATAVLLDRMIWFWLILLIGFALTTKYTAGAREKKGYSYKPVT